MKVTKAHANGPLNILHRCYALLENIMKAFLRHIYPNAPVLARGCYIYRLVQMAISPTLYGHNGPYFQILLRT